MRLRQQHPSNYGTSANISAEFENIVRYLNAAEFGNKTISELLDVLFDSDGVFEGPIELRNDGNGNIEYRVGTYTDPEDGWEVIIPVADLRGEPGTSDGTIGAPIIYGRYDVEPAAAVTDIDYSHGDTDELLVYVDGVLQREGASYDYTHDPSGGTGSAGVVQFNSGFAGTETVSIWKIRDDASVSYSREDTVTTSSQSVFPYSSFSANAQLYVYLNGLLQREGGSHDYVDNRALNTLTFGTPIPSGNTVTILGIDNTEATVVTGLMLEETFCHTDTGLIKYAKVQIGDGDIPQAKVNGLATGLAEKPKITVSATSPASPVVTDLWLDTSVSPNQLWFHDGVQFIRTSPETALPTVYPANANQLLYVNGTGTGLQFKALDTTGLVLNTVLGAANGVATLDASGKLTSAQLPEVAAVDCLHHLEATPAATTYQIKRVYGQKLRIDAIALRMTAGTCTVQLSVDGSLIGSTYSASTTPNETALSSAITVDATASSSAIEFAVTGPSGAANLEVTLKVSVLTI